MKILCTDRFLKCIEIDEMNEYRKWSKEIPFINFPNEWNIKIIPPFLGAIARFYITLKKCSKVNTSVYLDCYDLLGFVERPYWEIYPINGIPERCLMNDTKRLLELIEISLNQQLKTKKRISRIKRKKKRENKRRH